MLARSPLTLLAALLAALVLGAAASAGLPAPAAAQEPSGVQKLKAAQTDFRVCAAPDDLPFSNRRGEGFDNRIAQLLAAAEHKQLTYSWWTAPHGLVNRRLDRWDCDVVMGVPTGYDQTLTTTPYYCSTYVAVTRADRALTARDPARGVAPDRIGVLVSTPPLDLLLRQHINPRVYIPSQDEGANARKIVDDVAAGHLDVAFVWGPVGGYFAARESPALRVMPMPGGEKDPTLRLTFPVSLGVRHGDQERLAQLNGLLRAHARQIRAILRQYGVPLAAGPSGCGRSPAAGALVRTAGRAPAATPDPPRAADPSRPRTAPKISCTGIKTLDDVAKLAGRRAPGRPYTVRGNQVDYSTYIGWTRFAAFCERCHGPGGSGTSIAPDLTAAVKNFNKRQFETVVTCGVQGHIGAGVMPAWGDNPNIIPYLDNLWSYLLARSDGGLGAGRPEKLPGGSH